jgi:hypothetical protein
MRDVIIIFLLGFLLVKKRPRINEAISNRKTTIP